MSEQKPRTLIYSNRPPTAGSSGGAQAVIEAANPTWWVGPSAVDDTHWVEFSAEDREKHTQHGTSAPYDVLTFPTPKSLEDAQYKTISNEILWPLAHSMNPNTSLTIEQIEDAYFGGYLRHNELANVAIHNLAEQHGLTAQDKIWVHDYQCTNVPGMMYSSHIPWPSVDFLESVTLPTRSGGEAKLIDSAFYRDYIELASGRALSTFQRPIDQVNFLMTAAYVAGSPDLFKLQTSHPALQNLTHDVRDPEKRPELTKLLLSQINISTPSFIELFGDKTMLLNVPVGQVTSQTYAEARENEGALNLTSFKESNGQFAIFNAGIGDGKTINLTACDPARFSAANPPKLADLVEPIRGRDWVLSVHRNDYTKGTMTKLDAAEQVLEKNPNATFLFILQPTREDVGGYKEYAESVFKKATQLREKYGEKSVVIIPEAVKHPDIMGLMRQKEMKGFMGLGHKDGHDLTVREVVDANEPNTPIGVITSSGIGASDVLGSGDKGAFVIQNPTDSKEVAKALDIILHPAAENTLSERFRYMKEKSVQYDAANFSRTISGAYDVAMKYRFGTDWQKTFQQPDGNFRDRKGKEHPPEKARPDYIEAILSGDGKPSPGHSR